MVSSARSRRGTKRKWKRLAALLLAATALSAAWLGAHPETEIDYIHGENTLRALAGRKGCVGFLLPEIDKRSFFEDVKTLGVLPRKTFSMGEAEEKRFYMEMKRI